MSYINEFDPEVIEYLQALWLKYVETGDIYWAHVGNYRAKLYEWEHSTGTPPIKKKRLSKPTKGPDPSEWR